MAQTDFMHFDTDSQKSKVCKIVLDGHGQKCVWPVWSRNSKINCISKMSRRNKLIFCMLAQIQQS